MHRRIVRRRGERGQTLVITALVFPLVLMPFLFGIADLSTMGTVSEGAQQAAFQGARGGASVLNSAALDSSSFQVSTSQALQACDAITQQNMAGTGLPGSPVIVDSNSECSASGKTVKDVVNITVSLPFPSFVNNRLTSTYSAQLQCGVNTNVC